MVNNSRRSINILEVFSSVQGEGPYVGCRQLFIRFALCNLDCAYCDTKFIPQDYCKMEVCPGSGTFKDIKNPITVEQLIYKVEELTYFNHHSISLTGGEPLLSLDYISNFLTELKKRKEYKIYLETNGTLPDELEKVIDYIDIISMDFKLESSTNVPTPWLNHKEFVEIAQKNNKEIFAKIVVTKNITNEEIENIIGLIKNQQAEIPLIIQPVDSIDLNLVPDSAFLMNVQEAFLRKLSDVRLIPQVHKYLKLI